MARTVRGRGQENWRVQGYDDDEHSRKAKMGEICGELDAAQPPPLPVSSPPLPVYSGKLQGFPTIGFPGKTELRP